MITTDRNDPALRVMNETGQQCAHIVLSEAERAKGFIRPVRDAYKHTGKLIERYPDGRLYGRLIKFTDPEYTRHDNYYNAENGYGGYIEYPEDHPTSVIGRYITTEELKAIVDRKRFFGRECGGVTTMPKAIAETYARDPKYYGKTFCTRCADYYPIEEFQWHPDGGTLGS